MSPPILPRVHGDQPECLTSDKLVTATPKSVSIDPPCFVVERMLPMAKMEAEYLRWVLKLANGNKAYAARMLQMDRSSYYRALKRADRILPRSECEEPRAPLSERGEEKAENDDPSDNEEMSHV